MKRLTRRNVVTGMAAFGTAAVVGAEELAIDIANMLPGEFAWHPERAPSGPVAVIASIPEQRVHVYRNGLRIAVSTCSTGKTGHETPTGVFTVLQKDKHHRSSTYNNAPMPNMNRLTWDGIALHAGNLPGYPASHGCVRLPLAFSEKLFGVTHLGTPVIIAGARTDPWELIHPGLLLGHAGFESDVDAVLSLKGKARPTDWTDAAAHPVSTVLVTADDRTVTVIENSQVVASGPLTIKGGAKLGEHVFVLNGLADGGLHWSGITHHPDPANPLAAEETVLNRLSTAPDLAGEILARKHVGMTMILSDLPVSPDRRSGEDFVIMDGRLLQSPLPHDRPAGLKRG